MSVAPPAGKPTMMRTGRDGQACARTMREAAGNAATPKARCRNVRRGSFMDSPSRSALYRGRAIQQAQWGETMPVLQGGGSLNGLRWMR